MGLDVYLKRWEQPRGWESYNDNVEDYPFTTIEILSEKYPQHLFKIGYFRSSYNETGMNIKLPPLIGLDLYSIFNPPDFEDDYHFQPDWQLALSITEKAIADLQTHIEKGGYGVMEVFPRIWGTQEKPVTNEAEALQRFQEIAQTNSEQYGSKLGNFTATEGRFFLTEPITVYAILNAYSDGFLSKGKFRGHYVIYKDESLSWYVEALEIVAETCRWVLAKPDIDHYCLAWG